MSKKTDELAVKLADLKREALELETVEAPTEEQSARMEVIPTEWDTTDAAYKASRAQDEKFDAIRAAAVEPINREPAFHAPNVIVRNDPFEDMDGVSRLSDDEARDRALRAYGDDVKLRGLSSKEHETLVDRLDTVRGASAYALVHGSPAYRSAFNTFFAAGKRGMQPIYSQAEVDAVRASMALGSTTGGAALPTLLDPTLIHTGTASKDPLRSVARVITGTQNVWHGVSVGNVTSAWVAENTALSDGTPTFAAPSVTAAKLTAFLTASYEIFEDSDLQGQMPGLIAEKFSYDEQAAFVVGSGSNAPKGIVTAISATAASTVTATTRGSFTSASAVDVFAVLAAVPSRYEDTSTWVANKSWFNTVRQMSTASQGSFFWTNFNNDTTGQGGSQHLLGSPTVQASDMNTSFASGSVIAILGDWSQFVIYDRIGTTVEFVQNVFNSSGLPLGQRGLVAHKRVGSDCTDINAFRFLKA